MVPARKGTWVRKSVPDEHAFYGAGFYFDAGGRRISEDSATSLKTLSRRPSIFCTAEGDETAFRREDLNADERSLTFRIYTEGTVHNSQRRTLTESALSLRVSATLATPHTCPFSTREDGIEDRYPLCWLIRWPAQKPSSLFLPHPAAAGGCPCNPVVGV